MARLVSIWYGALLEVRFGNTERVAALADEMHALVDEYALAHGRNACRWFRGYADSRMGAPRDGYQIIRDAYEENARLGMLAGASEILGYATEALVLAGDLDRAQKQLEEALHVADELGERVYLPQLYLLEAAIARAHGERTTAEGSVRRAIAETRAQQAPWLELMALIDLCENDHATHEDGRALTQLVEQLPDASETTAVAKARRLMETKPA